MPTACHKRHALQLLLLPHHHRHLNLHLALALNLAPAVAVTEQRQHQRPDAAALREHARVHGASGGVNVVRR